MPYDPSAILFSFSKLLMLLISGYTMNSTKKRTGSRGRNKI
jgi:hypothetical protein